MGVVLLFFAKTERLLMVIRTTTLLLPQVHNYINTKPTGSRAQWNAEQRAKAKSKPDPKAPWYHPTKLEKYKSVVDFMADDGKLKLRPC
jgi:hypothetical protein